MTRFNPGDLVVLKSGGPKMTIEKIGNPLVFCAWFKGDDRVRDNFHPEALELWDAAQARAKQSVGA